MRCWPAEGDAIRIGLTPDDFLGWQGGNELFQLIAACLDAARLEDDRIEILLSARHGRIARLLRAGRRRAGDTIRRRVPAPPLPARLRGLIGPEMKIGWSRGPRDRARFDVLGPLGKAPARAWRTPWLGYIPDLQHRSLPAMFSADERAARDRHFSALLAGASAVIVNAAAVARDVLEAYPDVAREIVVLPFAACAEPEWFEAADGVAGSYGIADPYFLCSNQFWKHKNHRVLLEALALARREQAPLSCVFTGDPSDYRHPGHFAALQRLIESAGIRGDVHLLGFIPKRDQLQLMRGARAVVQPSLFEGGPGGGAVYNAIALGQATIVSDLPVNREIDGLVTHFFDPHAPAELLAKMRTVLENPPPRRTASALLREGEARRLRCGILLRRAFADAARVRQAD